ncbi:MAG: hypothetical protein ACSHYA_17490 [Opitutaceae bacterium]
MKVTYFVLIIAFLSTLTSNASAQAIDATVLVNFTSPDKRRLAPASASDYQRLAPDVDPAAIVNPVSSGANDASLKAIGLNDVKITVSSTQNWNTIRGHFTDTAILDSYIFAPVTSEPLEQEVVISGLNEIADGQEVTVTIWGVGDGKDSSAEFTIDYDGKQSEVQTTDYNAGSPEAASTSFTFRKVNGVDNVTILWGNHRDVISGLAGFALTTNSNYVAIPEPQTFALLLGCLTLGASICYRRPSRP